MKADRFHPMARKVPEVIALFWIVKVLTTAMGESTSDYLVKVINPPVAVAFGAIALVIALAIQLRVRKYIAWTYWVTVAMVAVFGTMAADVLHIGLGIPYAISTIFFAVALAVVFIVWYISEKTLSIHSIATRRRELFYWVTVLATFALGTAAGDLTAATLHFGYFGSAVLFAAAIAVPAITFWKFGLNEITAFWTAYILTRPLGASFADWFGKPHYLSGLGWGDGGVSLVLAGLIVIFVSYLQISKADTK